MILFLGSVYFDTCHYIVIDLIIHKLQVNVSAFNWIEKDPINVCGRRSSSYHKNNYKPRLGYYKIDWQLKGLIKGQLNQIFAENHAINCLIMAKNKWNVNDFKESLS